MIALLSGLLTPRAPGLLLIFCVPLLFSSARATDLIYLNRCAGGCTITPGPDDAINHVSSLLLTTRNLPAFPYGDSTLAATAGCLRRAFAPYDVAVTTLDPGPVARREILMAGFPTNLGLPSGITAIAPLYPQPRDNTLAFVFAEELTGDVDRMCWLAAQQIGILYTLDNELHCPDLMSSSIGCGVKTFVDITVACGISTPQDCFAGGSTQNSAVKLAVNPGLGDRLFLSDFELPAPSP